MQANALTDDPNERQELRYLTAHFRDLQGLRTAPFWAALFVLVVLAKSGLSTRSHLAWASLILAMMQLGWLRLSGLWYERRYGVVKEPESPVFSGLTLFSGITSIFFHPEGRQAAMRRHGYYYGAWWFVIIIWVLMLLPRIFDGDHGRPGEFAMLVTTYQILPRSFPPVRNSHWTIHLRRALAAAAVLAIIGIYIGYRRAQVDLWTWMAILFGVLLLLDIYDHWLLNRLLSFDFNEVRHE